MATPNRRTSQAGTAHASATRMLESGQEYHMCDYSLMGVPNRLAREAEKLIVHRFPTGTLGLASPTDLYPRLDSKRVQARSFWSTLREFFSPPQAQSPPAVCIPPGAILMLHDIPTKIQNELGIRPDERVTFTQTTAAANRHRD